MYVSTREGVGQVPMLSGFLAATLGRNHPTAGVRKSKIPIKIKFDVDIPGRGYSMPFFETLYLDTLAPVSKNAQQAVFGRWTSDSKYIGRTRSGNYYVVHEYDTYGYPFPIAYFQDNDPQGFAFMALRGFLPQKLASSGPGYMIRWTRIGPGIPHSNLQWIRWT